MARPSVYGDLELARSKILWARACPLRAEATKFRLEKILSLVDLIELVRELTKSEQVPEMSKKKALAKIFQLLPSFSCSDLADMLQKWKTRREAQKALREEKERSLRLQEDGQAAGMSNFHANGEVEAAQEDFESE